MLVITTTDKVNHFFIGFGENNDSSNDHNVASILCKVWMVNTSDILIKSKNYNDTKK